MMGERTGAQTLARDILGWYRWKAPNKEKKRSNKQKNNTPLNVEEEVKAHMHTHTRTNSIKHKLRSRTNTNTNNMYSYCIYTITQLHIVQMRLLACFVLRLVFYSRFGRCRKNENRQPI